MEHNPTLWPASSLPQTHNSHTKLFLVYFIALLIRHASCGTAYCKYIDKFCRGLAVNPKACLPNYRSSQLPLTRDQQKKERCAGDWGASLIQHPLSDFSTGGSFISRPVNTLLAPSEIFCYPSLQVFVLFCGRIFAQLLDFSIFNRFPVNVTVFVLVYLSL